MNRTDSGSALKWGIAVVLVILGAGLLLWRLSGAGGGATAPTMVACQACEFRGMADIPIGFDQWPCQCPKCKERQALPAILCPKCGKLIPEDPNARPTACPHCKAPLAADEGP